MLWKNSHRKGKKRRHKLAQNVFRVTSMNIIFGHNLFSNKLPSFSLFFNIFPILEQSYLFHQDEVIMSKLCYPQQTGL